MSPFRESLSRARRLPPSGGPSCSPVEKPTIFGRQSRRGKARPAVGKGWDNWVKGVKLGGTRASRAWEEPGFSTGTDAQRRLSVVAGLSDWQAEHQESGHRQAQDKRAQPRRVLRLPAFYLRSKNGLTSACQSRSISRLCNGSVMRALCAGACGSLARALRSRKNLARKESRNITNSRKTRRKRPPLRMRRSGAKGGGPGAVVAARKGGMTPVPGLAAS